MRRAIVRNVIRAAVLLVSGLVLASACGDGVGNETPAAMVTATAQPTPTATAAPDSTPLPRHVTFAPGETIDTGGEAGVVFVDPESGAADGWLLPGGPLDYVLQPVALDGHLLRYGCLHRKSRIPPAGCEGSTASYLFNTATSERTRLEIPGGDFAIAWPEGDDALVWAGGQAKLINIERPSESQTIPLASGFELSPGYALWNVSGTAMVLFAFQRGAAHCTTPAAPGGFHACGTDPNLTKTLLLDREAGTTRELGETRTGSVYAAWSPDGSKLAVVGRLLDKPTEISVYGRDGEPLWSQQRFTHFPNPRWSPDGTSIAVQVLSRPELVAAAMRLDVLDAATGETRYRIVGAVGCDGRLWTSDGARLVLEGAYGFPRSVLADPRDGALRSLRVELGEEIMPSLTTPNIAYRWGYSGLTDVDLDTGETRRVAAFSSPLLLVGESKAPLFNGRYAFIAGEPGGHGGCAEAIDPASPPTTHFEFPPFDD